MTLPGTRNQTRSRTLSVLLSLLTLLAGLASRKFSVWLPAWLAKNAGDALYAVLIFWLAGLIAPRLSTPRCALTATGFCFGIEFLKFSQVPWLVAARHSQAGALVFGVGFHAQNLACYVVGVVLAALAEKAFARY